MQTTETNTLSAEDLWELTGAYPNHRLELDEGKLIVMTPTGGEHGELTVNLTIFVGVFIKSNNLGRVTGAETGYVLARDPEQGDIVRAPDLAFVKQAEPLPTGFVPFAPDLAVEVVSPSDRADAVQHKVRQYLQQVRRWCGSSTPPPTQWLCTRHPGRRRWSRRAPWTAARCCRASH